MQFLMRGGSGSVGRVTQASEVGARLLTTADLKPIPSRAVLFWILVKLGRVASGKASSVKMCQIHIQASDPLWRPWTCRTSRKERNDVVDKRLDPFHPPWRVLLFCNCNGNDLLFTVHSSAFTVHQEVLRWLVQVVSCSWSPPNIPQ